VRARDSILILRARKRGGRGGASGGRGPDSDDMQRLTASFVPFCRPCACVGGRWPTNKLSQGAPQSNNHAYRLSVMVGGKAHSPTCMSLRATSAERVARQSAALITADVTQL
jgi:hypothetical protein